MAAILNFRIFCKNCKTQKCLYLENCVREISTKFWTHWVSLQSGHPNFQTIFVSPKMVAILNFEFFAKIAKHKNAYISKTMRDREISTKFWTHWVSLQSGHPNFQTIFVSPKMVAILNFEFFAKIAKHKNAYISKTMRDRAISTKYLTHRVYLQRIASQFSKNFCLAQDGGQFEFSNFS